MSDFVKVKSCDELTPHRPIEARRDGVLHFAGRVTETMPAHHLFWAVSELGERRIVDLSEYDVYAPILDPDSRKRPASGPTHKAEEEAW